MESTEKDSVFVAGVELGDLCRIHGDLLLWSLVGLDVTESGESLSESLSLLDVEYLGDGGILSGLLKAELELVRRVEGNLVSARMDMS